MGIMNGFTPAAADWAGRQLADPGASQQRVVDAIEENFGSKIGHEKLRGLSSHLADSMETRREECQRAQLLGWLADERGERDDEQSVSRGSNSDGYGGQPMP